MKLKLDDYIDNCSFLLDVVSCSGARQKLRKLKALQVLLKSAFAIADIQLVAAMTIICSIEFIYADT